MQRPGKIQLPLRPLFSAGKAQMDLFRRQNSQRRAIFLRRWPVALRELLDRPKKCRKRINADVARGVPLGRITWDQPRQGQFVFTAMQDTVNPEALANPYDRPRNCSPATSSRIPVLKGVITDSHFSQRESLAFLAPASFKYWVGSPSPRNRSGSKRPPCQAAPAW